MSRAAPTVNDPVPVWMAVALGGLGEAFAGAPPSEAKMRVYHCFLYDVPRETLEGACARAVKECRFFPTVAELRQLCGEPSAEDAALRAWGALDLAAANVGAYASIEIEDGAAVEALLQTFGSWPQFCHVDRGPELALKRQQFIAVYRTARLRPFGRQRLAGLLEAEGTVATGLLAARVWRGVLTAGGGIEIRRGETEPVDRPENALGGPTTDDPAKARGLSRPPSRRAIAAPTQSENRT